MLCERRGREDKKERKKEEKGVEKEEFAISFLGR